MNKPRRQMPPRAGQYLLLGLCVWIVGSALTFIAWRHFMPFLQRAELKAYIDLSVRSALPGKHQITLNHLRKILGDKPLSPPYGTTLISAVDRRDRMKLLYFENETAWEIIRVPLYISGVWFIVCLIGSAVLFSKETSKFKDGIKLRGPDRMTVDQFNKTVKGPGFRLRVEG